MKDSLKIKSILFDMDGVIVDSMKVHASSWKQVLGEHGLQVNDIDIYRREGMAGRTSVEDIFLEKGVAVPGDEDFNLLQEKKHDLFESGSIDIFPLVGEMIDMIKKRQITCALVTGSMKRSVKHVLPSSLLSRFDAIVTAEDVINGKPDPEPYMRALEYLGSDPANALAVENAPMGIESAKRAGLPCFALKTTLPSEYLQRADRIFPDHKALIDYFEENI